MISFFDAEIGVGGTAFTYPSPRSPPELLATMDRYRIAQAFVYDRGAHESGVFDRFDGILEFCAASPRLHPTVPVVPPACGEQPPPRELVHELLARGVRAVRVCLAAHHFQFDPFSFGPLLEELAAHRLPVLHTSQRLQDHPWLHESDLRGIREVALAFPELPLVVLYVGMLENRRLLPLLAGCPNVLADLTCVSFSQIEYVAERFGAGRLVYASHFPTDDPGLYTTWVTHAGVSEVDRRRVAHDNLQCLLEGARA